MTPWLFLLAGAGMGCCALAQRWWHRRVLQSERSYRQLIERAPAGIAVVADNGHLRSTNPAFWQMLGSPPAQQIDILPFPPLVEAGIAADLHRCLLEGGIYLYPADEEHRDGKLRLLYECAPLGFVVEAAGGRASTGRGRILDLRAESLHQRAPLAIGSSDQVATFERFVARGGP